MLTLTLRGLRTPQAAAALDRRRRPARSRLHGRLAWCSPTRCRPAWPASSPTPSARPTRWSAGRPPSRGSTGTQHAPVDESPGRAGRSRRRRRAGGGPASRATPRSSGPTARPSTTSAWAPHPPAPPGRTSERLNPFHLVTGRGPRGRRRGRRRPLARGRGRPRAGRPDDGAHRVRTGRRDRGRHRHLRRRRQPGRQPHRAVHPRHRRSGCSAATARSTASRWWPTPASARRSWQPRSAGRWTATSRSSPAPRWRRRTASARTRTSTSSASS